MVAQIQAVVSGYLLYITRDAPQVLVAVVYRDEQLRVVVQDMLPRPGKDALFPTVRAEGALPRKTFSMGEANEKRFYMEARALR